MDILRDIKIDRTSDEFIYIQLFNELSHLIEKGELRAYEKLPPIRTLSRLLDLNNVTIVNAYKMLEQSGLIHKKIGSGTYISPRFTDEDGPGISDENLINFSSTTPPIELFPVDDFKISMNEVIDRDRGSAFQYHEGKGYKPLREIFERQLSDYGINVSPDDIQIISGVQQGIDIVSKALVNQGDTVLVEGPTYAGAIGSFRLRGANIVEIPLGENGVDIDVFEDAVIKNKPKIFYTIPNFQNPSGVTYDEGVKKEIVRLSQKYGFYIIEDDYATDLAFSGEVPKCMKAYDEHNRVIYLKSFSKLFMPGLRIGFMIVPNSMEDAIMFAKHTSDISTSGIMQRVFDNYLRSGRFERQSKLVYKTLKDRYLSASYMISSKLPKSAFCRIPSGGVNFWITLSSGIDAELFFRSVEDHGIKVVRGESFFSGQTKENHFRISVAGLETNQIEYGLDILFKIMEQCQRSRGFMKGLGNMPI